MSLFNRLFNRKRQSQEEKAALDEGLKKTKSNIFNKLSKAVAGKSVVDEEVLDQLEEALITADVGVDTTITIIDNIEKRVAKDKYLGVKDLNMLLQDEIAKIIIDAPEPEFETFDLPEGKKPYVILVVGVNGVGKTTTIGKLAHHYKQNGKKVLLGAGDTFRAAAVDQLNIWSERVGVPIVKKPMGSDPSSVAFETMEVGLSTDADVILIDTAGRLHNKIHLMDELSKIKRVISKKMPDAPHEVLLVLDGSTGQNALEQAKQFTSATNINSLAITKLDGTAKGGVVLAIANHFKIPVKYIGVGEQMEHLQIFNKYEFVDSLFSLEN